MQVKLSVVKGPHEGREFVFDRHDNFIVGRAPSAQFRLPQKDGYFSRNHFLIEVNPPLCRLLDLNSRNGTFVNGKRVTSLELKDGDVIRGGKTFLRVSIEGAAQPVPAAAPVLIPPDQTIVPRNWPARDSAGGPPGTSTTPMQPGGSSAGPATGATAEPDATTPAADLESTPDLPQPDGTPAAARGVPQPWPEVPGYKLIERIGRGGMGVVFKAAAERDGSIVAVKVVLPQIGAAPEELARFVREAQILKDLSHPHIVPFHALDHAGGRLFFVMDYIAGVDVHRLMQDSPGPLPVPRAVAIACQLLDALAEAHRRGYVHRDVKPSNLLIEQRAGRDHAWLADFGLARAYQSSRLSGLTLTGAVGGTTPFMPPEQITDYRHVGPPADQYSAAATLYHLLTKQFTYDLPRDVPRQLLMILQESPVPIERRRRDLPPKLAGAIGRALSRFPGDRFPDVAAFSQALRAAVSGA